MIHTGECVEVMRTMPDASVDAVVTDPPYNLNFMGKAWDKNLNHGEWATEAFRVLKPGGYLLAFGGTRTVHRLASAIEDAGFEIRDELVWIYASGFPKSLDVSKAMDKAAGAEREVVGEKALTKMNPYAFEDGQAGTVPVTAPATDLARQWQGWGTALKPAHEPIVMARKPLVGTVAANVTRYGTGALNVDGCRIPGEVPQVTQGVGEVTSFSPRTEPRESEPHDAGRWPSNVLLSDPELFDQPNPGVVGSGATDAGGGFGVRGDGPLGGRTSFALSGNRETVGYGDAGGYSRFFIIPKADRAEREPVLRGQLPKAALRTMGDGAGEWSQHGPDNQNLKRENSHPTVKPVDLMRHLVRLVTPPGGTVLDPFLGSGSTAIACELEGFPWVGIEREPEYVAIAEARLNGTQRGLGLDYDEALA